MLENLNFELVNNLDENIFGSVTYVNDIFHQGKFVYRVHSMGFGDIQAAAIANCSQIDVKCALRCIDQNS